MSDASQSLRRINPPCQDRGGFAFSGGSFDTGHRPYTARVNGAIRLPHHLVMATLEGGAESIEVATECGHRYVGADRPGAVSFVPARCARDLRMRGVSARWASIAWRPSVDSLGLRPFTNCEDPFLLGLATEFFRQFAAGVLDARYCEAMTQALDRYVAGRYGEARREVAAGLAPWRLRRVARFVDAHLAAPLTVADLAEVAGVSAGHFHRAFLRTTGATPCAYLRERRVETALAILRHEPVSVTEAALRVGFQSPSRLAAHVRARTGLSPSQVRAEAGSNDHSALSASPPGRVGRGAVGS